MGCLKYVSLVVLMIQTALVTLLIRYILTREGDCVRRSTLVPLIELTKLVCCLVVVFVQAGYNVGRFIHFINKNVIQQPLDCLKVSVPSIIYALQNNLLYVAMANLEPATFQVTYQMKILTTALFSVVLLRKKLSLLQWVSLVLLFIGVSLVQINSQNTKLSPGLAEQNPFIGLVAVLVCCMMSGFAGVYFEKILKGGRHQDIWILNIQMCSVGVISSTIVTQINDSPIMSEKGYFFGYDWVVWTVILGQALGGLLVALVVKYADNILKGFASSGAIIVSCVASVYIFDFVPSVQFVFGSSIVIAAVCLYSGTGYDRIRKQKYH